MDTMVDAPFDNPNCAKFCWGVTKPRAQLSSKKSAVKTASCEDIFNKLTHDELKTIEYLGNIKAGCSDVGKNK